VHIPVFLNVAERRILVVGGGPVGARKAATLCAAGASVTMVSPSICAEAHHLPLNLRLESFKLEHLIGVDIVYACTNNKELNHHILELCRERRILCQPTGISQAGDFLSATSFQWGKYTVAISSTGQNIKGAMELGHKLQSLLEQINE
jgi:precorrin-2 dehydrogenase / sirohydrochlorin ferrochelatase